MRRSRFHCRTSLALADGVTRSLPFQSVNVLLSHADFGKAQDFLVRLTRRPEYRFGDGWWINGRNRSLSAFYAVDADATAEEASDPPSCDRRHPVQSRHDRNVRGDSWRPAWLPRPAGQGRIPVHGRSRPTSPPSARSSRSYAPACGRSSNGSACPTICPRRTRRRQMNRGASGTAGSQQLSANAF